MVKVAGTIFMVIRKMGTMVVIFPWCTCDQGFEEVPYSLDLSIQTLDEHWFGFAPPQAKKIDCYNISKMAMIHVDKMFRNLPNPLDIEDFILEVSTVATSTKLLGGGREKVPIKAGSFRRPTPIFWSEWLLPWIIGMLPVTCELLGRNVCWSTIVIPPWKGNAIFLK